MLTLLTDFGPSDGYAGALRGAIARVAPRLQVVTITHGVPAHDIGAGAYWLGASAPAFPPGTVHCCVVDPGVGTERPLVAARVDDQVVLAPDNGLLHFLWEQGRERVAVHVETAGMDLAAVSPTFHGRDLIGPLAARLATNQVRLEDLGAKVSSPHLLPDLLPGADADGTMARVLVVDHFGNVILAVARTPWYQPLPGSAETPRGRLVDTLVRTYGEIKGDCAMLWNSAGHLELACRERSAAELLQLRPGDVVRVYWAEAAERPSRSVAGRSASPK